MILDEVVLHDFGVYRGRQTVQLTPVAEDKPVILLGALNGAGKTTFLEAVQLALYGQRAPAVIETGEKYDRILQQKINREADARSGAAVEVMFRRFVDGREVSYRVHRSWKFERERLKEVFDVIVDGERDRVATQNWSEIIEDILPSRIASLFFFDGEKISQFADPRRSAEMISTAISALLGLDIVHRLSEDLTIYERRLTKDGLETSKLDELQSAERELESKREELKKKQIELATDQSRLDQATQRSEKAQHNFAREGGNTHRSREDLLTAVTAKRQEKASTEISLRRTAAGVLPLTFVRDQIAQISTQDSQEQEIEQARLVAKVVKERDEEISKLLSAQKVAGKAKNEIEKYLASSRSSYDASAAQETFLNITSAGRNLLAGMEKELSSQRTEANELMASLESLDAKIYELERTLERLPTPEAIESLMNELKDAEESREQAKRSLIASQEEFERRKWVVSQQEVVVAKLYAHEVKIKNHQADAERSRDHSNHVREVLQEFKQGVICYHIDQLETLILECLGKLFRKESFISHVSIDPETFEITLKDGAYRIVDSSELSAGERQMFAISILWALAIASGCTFPAIIDTPLARLDSVHRDYLVDRYFPFASHQVILLSTDEEIDRALYDNLEPWISRSYTSIFKPGEGGSSLTQGYQFAA